MPLKVIGAGFPRTGTTSLKLALEELGFGPCHHMIEVFQHPQQPSLWTRKFNGEPVDWEELLEGYSSLTDAPGCFFYRELAEYYPGAPVILSLRSAESWWNSASTTVMSPRTRERIVDVAGGGMPAMFQAMSDFLGRRDGEQSSWHGMTASKEAAIASFERHNANVRAFIKPERLLVFEAKEGWEPLCKFLRVPVPDKPYPRANTREDFGARNPATAR